MKLQTKITVVLLKSNFKEYMGCCIFVYYWYIVTFCARLDYAEESKNIKFLFIKYLCNQRQIIGVSTILVLHDS